MKKRTINHKSSVAPGGFTLLELMLVVLIVGVIASAAVPAYKDFIGSAKFSRSSDALRHTIEAARGSALAYGYPTVVCSSVNPESATPACRGASKTNWGDGWIAFVDCDGDKIVDTGNVCDFDPATSANDAPEVILRAK